MKIEEKEIEHLAELSRIELKSEEKKTLVKDAQEIVDFFDEMAEVETKEVKAGNDLNLSEVVKDEEREDRGTDKEKEQFIKEEKRYLKIPKVFE